MATKKGSRHWPDSARHLSDCSFNSIRHLSDCSCQPPRHCLVSLRHRFHSTRHALASPRHRSPTYAIRPATKGNCCSQFTTASTGIWSKRPACRPIHKAAPVRPVTGRSHHGFDDEADTSSALTLVSTISTGGSPRRDQLSESESAPAATNTSDITMATLRVRSPRMCDWTSSSCSSSCSSSLSARRRWCPDVLNPA